jgi:hypothetical protein
MKAATFVVEKQIAWAVRNGIPVRQNLRITDQLGDYRGQQYRTAYTARVADNLFEELSDDVRGEFEAGDGGELTEKMAALYSSSALACNLFHHLRRIGRVDLAGQALGCSSEVTAIQFEQQRPIMANPKASGFHKNPNLDVILTHGPKAVVRETAIECKFIEPYRDKPKGIKSTYLETAGLWSLLPNCRRFTESIGTGDLDGGRTHLHASQLLKHILGLAHRNGPRGFELIYLYFAVPGEENARHEAELNSFATAVNADGIRFRAVSVQEFVLNLWRHRNTAPAFMDYLTNRYF